jgi:hypothetical protein
MRCRRRAWRRCALGDAKSSLGDAESSLGDAKSWLGDAKSLLGDAKSFLGDAYSSLGDAKSSLGDAKKRLLCFASQVGYLGGGAVVVPPPQEAEAAAVAAAAAAALVAGSMGGRGGAVLLGELERQWEGEAPVPASRWPKETVPAFGLGAAEDTPTAVEVRCRSLSHPLFKTALPKTDTKCTALSLTPTIIGNTFAASLRTDTCPQRKESSSTSHARNPFNLNFFLIRLSV